MFERYLGKQIAQDLQKKMVFIGGPRQVGKTTLAQTFLKSKKAYLNWDISRHREMILCNEIPEEKTIVFDELHKYRNWRSWLKGQYDLYKSEKQFIVTGSARLDYYRYGGDSLQGRYHYLRLYPLTVAELKIKTQDDFNELLNLGGFPEPYFSSNEVEAKRWSREYRERFLRDDLQSVENLLDLGAVEQLMLRLPQLVGSPLSVNSLREDLQKSQPTIANWLNILERLYCIFRISPFGPAKIYAVKKEQKHYHYDWTLIKEPSFRFENMVALHLLKWTHYMLDTTGEEYELRYFRDKYKREVDFVITHDNLPILFIECKLSSTNLSEHLFYLREKFPKVRSVQVVAQSHRRFVNNNVEVIPAIDFLQEFI